MLITLSLFVAMVPVALLCFSWLTGFSSSANLASLVIRHYDPLSAVQRLVTRSALPSAASSGACAAGASAHSSISGPWREGGAAGRLGPPN